jgi:hypothetical protein
MAIFGGVLYLGMTDVVSVIVWYTAGANPSTVSIKVYALTHALDSMNQFRSLVKYLFCWFTPCIVIPLIWVILSIGFEPQAQKSGILVSYQYHVTICNTLTYFLLVFVI